ncbi:MAG: JAB domain-containing protein [Candidatus Omnitrophica bacterium]|nr:JAB domain-containing protein [Candidatus Omnitrophota bacterium]
MKIKEIPKVERPREKLIRYSSNRLSNSELLAIILRSGKKGENVIDLANRILRKYKAENLPNLTYQELKDFSGLGPAKACEIIACFELGKRLLKGKVAELYLKPEDVWKELKDIREHKKEHFIIFYLDSRNQEIKREIISVGSLNANLVHPREVFEPAVKNLAAQVILAHNHPSGDPEPSEDDLEINKRLAEAGKILGIDVIDHIIVSKGSYLSFKEKGLL